MSTAAEGVEALKILSTGMKPVAILLDVMMPPMDGWDFRQRQLIDTTLARDSDDRHQRRGLQR